MTKDYYVVLGLDADATPEQIKSAYRQKVKQLHPDHYTCDDREPFLDVQQAYEVLSDPDRRQAYDRDTNQSCNIPIRTRNPWPAQPQSRRAAYGAEPLRPHKRSVNMGEVQPEPLKSQQVSAGSSQPHSTMSNPFSELLDMLWGHQGSEGFNTPSPSSSGSQLEADIRLTPAQAQRGGQIHAQLPLSTTCPACWGEGYRGRFRCRQCGGRGTITQHAGVSLPFPAGIANGTALQYSLAQLGLPHTLLKVHFRVM